MVKKLFREIGTGFRRIKLGVIVALIIAFLSIAPVNAALGIVPKNGWDVVLLIIRMILVAIAAFIIFQGVGFFFSWLGKERKPPILLTPSPIKNNEIEEKNKSEKRFPNLFFHYELIIQGSSPEQIINYLKENASASLWFLHINNKIAYDVDFSRSEFYDPNRDNAVTYGCVFHGIKYDLEQRDGGILVRKNETKIPVMFTVSVISAGLGDKVKLRINFDTQIEDATQFFDKIKGELVKVFDVEIIEDEVHKLNKKSPDEVSVSLHALSRQNGEYVSLKVTNNNKNKSVLCRAIIVKMERLKQDPNSSKLGEWIPINTDESGVLSWHHGGLDGNGFKEVFSNPEFINIARLPKLTKEMDLFIRQNIVFTHIVNRPHKAGRFRIWIDVLCKIGKVSKIESWIGCIDVVNIANSDSRKLTITEGEDIEFGKEEVNKKGNPQGSTDY